MNAAQIASQMRELSIQLVTVLGADDDIAAVLGHLAPAFAASGTALGIIADAAENSDGPGWDTVMSETGRANHLLAVTGAGLSVAAKAAKTEQNKTAALLLSCGDLKVRLDNQPGEGNAFFDALAALPHSAENRAV